jgi:hypothetical protein
LNLVTPVQVPEVPVGVGALVVEVVLEVTGLLVVVVEEVVDVVDVLDAAPGTHCEYQSFNLVQVNPETQVVDPEYPFPPPFP